MPKVSVIVPIYNVEKYLGKCLKSLENQTFKDIEVILVNDGSTDSSGKIAKDWAEKNNNAVYLEKTNGGLSDARNYGIKYAKGDFIAFLDSDDYLENDLFFNLKNYIDENYDLIKFQINVVNENGKILEKSQTEPFEEATGEEAFEKLFGNDKFLEPAWCYLYNRKFWLDNNFEYEKGCYHEDFGLTMLVLLKAKTVVNTNIVGYNYVQTSKSITRGNQEKKVKMAKDLIYHYDNMLSKIEKYNIDKKTKEDIKIYYTNSLILNIKNLSKNGQKEYIKELKKRKLYKNIKPRDLKQLIKRMLLFINVKLYLKLR